MARQLSKLMPVEECRYPVHSPEYLDATRAAHSIGVTRTNVTTANKPHHGHSGGERRTNPAQTVFDHETPFLAGRLPVGPHAEWTCPALVERDWLIWRPFFRTEPGLREVEGGMARRTGL